MKPRKTFLFRSPGVLALLVSSVVFFAGCKKDNSFETQEPTISVDDQSSTDSSEKVSAQAASAYEGFGANAVGGSSSSTVYHVTNLNSSGSGSLANGIGSNKTIVFDVSGTITGRFDLTKITYLTIDATGQNITIDGNNNGDVISFDGSGTHHCILKGVHVTNGGNDGINVVDGAHDIIISNCTSYGNRDGNIDIAGANNVTVQYCILGKGASGWAGDMLITSTNVSVHHNLFSPATSNEVGERCPFVHCNYSSVGSPNADIRNNIMWNWGRNNATGSGYGTAVGYNATANVVNNYYYSASSSPNNAVSTSDGYGTGNTGKIYASGNTNGNGSNPNGVSNHAEWSVPSVTTQDACTAAGLVLSNAGPQTRNSVDLGYINAVTLKGCSSTPTNQPPVANAGNDVTLTLPTNSTTLQGSGSDPDGSIASYSWSRVSGPTAFTLGNANSASTTLSNLVQGTYVFKLTVTDNKGATGTDNVTITVNAGSVLNVPPTANAGSDISLTLPTNSTTLLGSGSDPDGSIASYSWSRVSGPSTFTLGNANSASTSLSNLVQGTYVFRLTVTDNKGATATDDVNVTVNSIAPPPPSGGFGTLTYSQGYDVSSSVNTSLGRRNSVSYSTYRTGPGSFRSEVRAGDRAQSGGFRSQMAYTSSSQNPTEGVVEYDAYYENWNSFDGGGSTMSWNSNKSGASAIITLQNYEGKFDVVRAIGSSVIHQSGSLMSISSNTWYKLRWEFKWSSGNDGYVRLYINDALYFSYNGQTADGSGQSLRVGQNRWLTGSGSSMKTTSVIYYDNLKIYSK